MSCYAISIKILFFCVLSTATCPFLSGSNYFPPYLMDSCEEVQTCHLGLKDHINKAKIIVCELECLLEDAASVVRTANEQDKDVNCDLDSFVVINGKEEVSSSHPSKPEVSDYASTMAIIYSMVKQDYMMQDRIISSLKLKSSAEELETYCQMWSLRPFVDDDIMHKAWSLVPSATISGIKPFDN